MHGNIKFSTRLYSVARGTVSYKR